jgi:hypothetical protein
MPSALNRNLTDINMLFSQQWYDAIKIDKERLINRDSRLNYIILAISMLSTLQLLITVGVNGTKIRTSTIYENSLVEA